MVTKALFIVSALALVLPLSSGCDGDGGPRAIGATCGTDSQCETGICGGGLCRNPDTDDDGDNLINSVEHALSSNPGSDDSDADGKRDDLEVGGDANNPLDWDGDGRPDVVESFFVDVDGDCIPDERDPHSDGPEADLNVVADLACCCGDRCSALSVTIASAQCTGGFADDGTGTVTDECGDDPDCREGGASGEAFDGAPSGGSTGAPAIAGQQPYNTQLTCQPVEATEQPLQPCGRGEGLGGDVENPGSAGEPTDTPPAEGEARDGGSDVP